MVMDGLNLFAAVLEAKRLVGGKIDKLQQPEKDTLVISARSGGENYRLLLSASPEHCRVQLTDVKRENPQEAPAFCMLLRKRLAGGHIVSVEQPNMDRAVYIGVRAQNELGDDVTYTIAAEVMGKYSNVILINENGVIVDAARRVGIGMSNVRLVMPGVEYERPPAQDKRTALQSTPSDVEAALSGAGRIDKALSNAFFGLAPSVADRMMQGVTEKRLCEELTGAERAQAAQYFIDVYQKLAAGGATPCIAYGERGEPKGVYPFLPKDEQVRTFGSMCAALDEFYAENDSAERMRRNGASIKKTLQNNIERCHKKLAIYDDAINADEGIERLKLFGELLTANMYRIKQGAAEAAVENYYIDPPEPVVIPLDVRLAPNDNAQRYFKKYQKTKASRDMARTQREQTLLELDYLEGQLDNFDKCTTFAELREMEDELRAEGYLKREKGREKRQKLPPSKPLRFVSSDGIDIYVGKNNRQNDELTLKFASVEDTWLHTKDIPGSHVIIHAKEPPRQTLYEAALLAAYYSKARGGQNVQVDYALRKFVKKPSGAKPGMVIYTTHRTAVVTPDPLEVKNIRAKE